MKRSTYLFLLITLALLTSCGSEHALSDYQFDPNELLLTNNNQDRIRIRSYGPMLRIQYAKSGKEFFPDDHYEMVEDHEMGGEMENLFLLFGSRQGGKALLTCYISKDLASSRDLNAGTIVRELGRYIQGGGGGQPFFATAGGKNPDGISEALARAGDYIQ